MTISLIVAMAQDGTIGHAGGMPWHIPADLAHFKEVTIGHSVIMGRCTFESIGRRLPKRRNVVVTSQRDWSAENVDTAPDLHTAVRLAEADGNRAFIIGGAQIYADALERAIVDELIISHVQAAPNGDTRLPDIDWSSWYATSSSAYGDSVPPFEVVTYRRSDQR